MALSVPLLERQTPIDRRWSIRVLKKCHPLAMRYKDIEWVDEGEVGRLR